MIRQRLADQPDEAQVVRRPAQIRLNQAPTLGQLREQRELSE